MSGTTTMSWRERISRARKRGRFTDREKEMALGTGWDRCAVGEQRRLHPRVVIFRFDTYPEDAELSAAGFAFGEAVQGDDFTDATRALAKIRQRVLKLRRGKP